MAAYTLAQHEYQVRNTDGSWPTATRQDNMTLLSDGRHRISGLTGDIAVGGLRVRVIAIGSNSPSDWLYNTVAFTAATAPVSDADYDAYVAKSQETDPTELAAIKNLITGLKQGNFWNAALLLYACGGNSQLTKSINLRNVNANQIQFSAGTTFSAAGIKWSKASQTFGMTSFSMTSLPVDNYTIAFNTPTDNNDIWAEFAGQSVVNAEGNPVNFDFLSALGDGTAFFEGPNGIQRTLPTNTRKGLSLTSVQPPVGPYTGENTALVIFDKNGVQLGQPATGGPQPAFTAGTLHLGYRAAGVLHSDGIMAGYYVFNRYFTSTERAAFAQLIKQYNADRGQPTF